MRPFIDTCRFSAWFIALLMAAACSREPTVIAPEPARQHASDALFPRRLASSAGTVIVHAPQIDEWIGYRLAQARVAYEVALTDGSPTMYGTGYVSAATETDLAARTVTLDKVNVERFVFSGFAPVLHERAGALVRSVMSKEPQQVPLDLFLGYLQDTAATAGAVLRMEPPPIFVSYAPAILVITNGKPVMAPIADSNLKYAVNTNWDLFRIGSTWYLRNEDQWLSAANPRGEWAVLRELPKEFSRLPDDDNWTEARAWIPVSSSRSAPKVFFSNTPAEMILVEGKPKIEPIGTLGLSYIANTQSDVFIKDSTYYYLASGRWFAAPALEGKWRAAGALPEAFASIPVDHAKARVRASVPGTEEAKRAVLEASIPRTAVLARSTTLPIAVTYDGEPRFVPISGTTLTRASNSMYDVISDGARYYLCYDAVWYAASTPSGPWEITTLVPPAIYSIPPSSPVHHVTYVKVYETSPTTVTSGYTSGYYGSYSSGTTVVFGTGYMYPPYIGYAALLPVYYWHPYSYGYGGWYNPNNGAFGEAIVAYGPYGGAGRTAAYNPSTGTYRRGYAMWDENEIAGTVRAYNPRTGTGAMTRGYATDDDAWSQTMIARGDEWIYSERERDGNTASSEIETSRGGEADITARRDGDTITRDATFEKNGRSLTSSGERSDGRYSGSFQTSGGASGTVNRSYDDGELSRNAQINRGGQSVDISGTAERSGDGVHTEFETSGGASGSVKREVDDGYVQRSGEVTRGDQTLNTELVRGSDGTVGRVENGEGESIGVARSEGGDLYAAKDGEVYRKTDNGWERNEGGAWKQSTPSATATSSQSDRVSELNREQATRERSFERYSQYQGERGGRPRARGGSRRR